MVKQQRTLFLIGTISIFGDRRIERTNEALFSVKSEVDSDCIAKGQTFGHFLEFEFQSPGNVIYVKS